MSKRKIIKIDEAKCNGCGQCIPNCPEGALKVIDGKARLISDLFCDGLGACLGHCPEGAITIEERDAEKYDEKKVMENIIKHGRSTIIAHLEHLKDHNEAGLLIEALQVLKEKGIENPVKEKAEHMHSHSGCPGSKIVDFRDGVSSSASKADEKSGSELRQWPVQLHLISPSAPYYKGADVVLSADCVAYSLGNFHSAYLKGRSLAIACPKLDSGQDNYKEKIKALIDEAKINTLTVMTMQVPCCSGLLNLAKAALSESKRKIPLKSIVVSLRGEILE